jgi:eukaryotic-like serine/threonine-protein kinase
MSARSHSRTSLLEDVVLPDRYRIVRRLARGGMASVWCAEDVVLDRKVAIKLLAEQFVDDQEAVRRFQREARTAARLSGHPNIVTIFDVGQAAPAGDDAPGRPFIVMEHLAGGTVADAIRTGNVAPEEALRWLREAAAALDYAHSRGVIHRDIKPGNLLLDRGRMLHVADFGIARIGTESTITQTGQLFGTAAYIAPEQALGRPASEASDRYSLAVVAFELLTGERPFVAGTVPAQARQHVEQPPPSASARSRRLPAAIDPILAAGMAKDPRKRYATASAFAEAIGAAVTETPVTDATRVLPSDAAAAPPPRAPGQTRAGAGGPRRRSRAIALAGLGTMAFGVGAAIGASSDGTHAPSHTRTSGIVASRAAPVTRHGPRPPHRHHAAPKPPPQQTTTATTAADTTTAPTAETLEARGHELMTGGNYPAAIAVLHQALAAASPDSLTHAYALYDLGRSLRLAGDPAAAVPILQQRLQIPNQTGVVRQELELALRALGSPSGGAAPAPADKHDKHPGKGHDHHPSGGAGE